MQWLELKIPPLALWLATAVLAAALGHYWPAANQPFAGHRLLAAIAFAAGVAIAFAGVVEFRRAKTTVSPVSPGRASSIVRSGIYRYTRNPMYLGMAVALLAVVAWFASLAALPLVPAFCAYLARFQIQPEERSLQASFGEQFASYRSQVRRWI